MLGFNLDEFNSKIFKNKIFFTGCSYVEHLEEEKKYRQLKWWENLYIWYYNNFEYIIITIGGILLIIIIYLHFKKENNLTHNQSGGELPRILQLQNDTGGKITNSSSNTNTDFSNVALAQRLTSLQKQAKLKRELKLSKMTPDKRTAYEERERLNAFKAKKKEAKKLLKMTPEQKTAYLQNKATKNAQKLEKENAKQLKRYNRSQSFKSKFGASNSQKLEKRSKAQEKLNRKIQSMRESGISNSELKNYRAQKEEKLNKRFRTSYKQKESKLSTNIEKNKLKEAKGESLTTKLKNMNPKEIKSKIKNIKSEDVKSKIKNIKSEDIKQLKDKGKFIGSKIKSIRSNKGSKNKSNKLLSNKLTPSFRRNKSDSTNYNERSTQGSSNIASNIGGEMYKFVFTIFITIALGVFIFPSLVLVILGFLTFIIAKDHLINLLTL